MNAQDIKIEQLLFNEGQIDGLPQNPRKIDDAQFQKLIKSLQDHPEMLSLRELIVFPYQNKFVVIGGNMRLKALKELGHKTIPCKILPKETDAAHLRAYTAKDNIGYGEWDYDLISAEWNELEMVEWGLPLPTDFTAAETVEDFEGYIDEDEIPVVEVNPKSKLGDIWKLGNHILMCGDSTNPEDVAKLMNNQKADLVWTDPPYNIAVKGKAGTIMNDDMSKDEFRIFLSKIYANYAKFMRQGAVIYVAHSESERIAFTDEFIKSGLKYAQTLIWVKQSAVMSRQDFNWKHEPILYGWLEGAAHYFCQDFSNTTVISQPDEIEAKYKEMNKDQLIKELRRIRNDNQLPSTVVQYDRPTISELHPTMKPVGLVELMLKWSSNINDIILDLFGGSGTTLIAAHKTNRHARIMELDPKFVDVIVKRWQDYTKQDAILISTNQTYNEIQS